MKKLLALTLTLCTMLSFLSIVPVEAIVYEGYPYIYADFATADSVNELSSGTEDVTWVEGGASGEGGCLYINQVSKGTGPMTDHHFNLPDAHFMVEGKFKISAWVKLDTSKTTLKANTIGFVFWGPTLRDSGKIENRWQTGWTVTDEKIASGEWVYIEKIMTWNGGMSGGTLAPDAEGTFQFSPRLGSVSNNVFGDSVKTGETLSWYLDDFIVEPVTEPYDPNAGAEEEPEDDTVLVNENFSNGLGAVGGYCKHTSENGADGTPGYGKVKVTKGTFGDTSCSALPFRYNKIFKTTFKMKADDADTVGSGVQLIFMRQNRLDKTNDKSNYEYITAKETLTTEWQEFEVYMVRNIRSFDESDLAVQIRVGNSARAEAAGVQWGKEGVAYSIDDVKIEEITNTGEFETKTAEVTKAKDGDTSKIFGTFYGWKDSGVKTEAVSDVPSDSTGKTAAKITATAKNGAITRPAFFGNNKEYEISFYAKGEGSSVGKSVQLLLNRTVSQKDSKDVYNVQDTETLGTDLVLSDTWQKYTIPYTSAFTAPAGTSAQIGPRQPDLSIVVDGGANGLTYYVDDFVITEKVPEAPGYPYPYVQNLQLNSAYVAGNTVTFSYEYISELDLLEGKSVVRILSVDSDGKAATLAQRVEPTNIYEYTIPESMVGKKIRFEVIPVAENEDGTQTFGAIYRIDAADVVKPELVVTPALSAFDAENGAITATLSVENNKVDGSDLALFIAVVLYDENDGVVRFDSKPLAVSNGTQGNTSLVVTTVNDTKLSPITKARAFVWGGNNVFDTDFVSYADVIEVAK